MKYPPDNYRYVNSDGVEGTFWAPSDTAALSKLQTMAMNGHSPCRWKLSLIGAIKDEPLYWFDREASALLTWPWAGGEVFNDAEAGSPQVHPDQRGDDEPSSF